MFLLVYCESVSLVFSGFHVHIIFMTYGCTSAIATMIGCDKQPAFSHILK